MNTTTEKQPSRSKPMARSLPIALALSALTAVLAFLFLVLLIGDQVHAASF